MHPGFPEHPDVAGHGLTPVLTYCCVCALQALSLIGKELWEGVPTLGLPITCPLSTIPFGAAASPWSTLISNLLLSHG